MKKLVLVLVAMFPLFCFSQNIIVANGNNSNTSNNQDQEECPYRINGICSTEDIGGVEFEFIRSEKISPLVDYYTLSNYNNFTVSVLVEYTIDGIRYTASNVLRANQKRQFKTSDSDYRSMCVLEGMIVRRLQ